VRARRRSLGIAAEGTAAVLFATAAGDTGGPAATLPLGDTTILGRLIEQLATLDVARAWVITRPQWADAVEAAAAGADVEVAVVASPDVADDLRAAVDATADVSGPLLLARGDAVTQREALAGLMADPRIVSGILVSSSSARGAWSFPTRSARGRVVSAASGYHMVRKPGPFFLGLLKVDPRDRAALADAAGRLADLLDDPPERWRNELARKATAWRAGQWLTERKGQGAERPEPAQWGTLELQPQSEATLDLRVRTARDDAVSLLLVGLVRSEVALANRHLRGFFYGRPRNAETAAEAWDRLQSVDEDRIALDAAVKGSDGFFTTFFVSPYSRYIARFAARRGWTPNAVTILSMVIGAVAAAAFATGSRAGLIAGAVLLQAAFTFDCVDGQLARYSRQFSKLGAWLDSVFDRGKEYLVYAGLAIGATQGFGDDVWTLAAAAMTMQTARHALDFSYGAGQRQVIATMLQLPLEHPEDTAGARSAVDADVADASVDDDTEDPLAAAEREREGDPEADGPEEEAAAPGEGEGEGEAARPRKPPPPLFSRRWFARKGRRAIRRFRRLDRFPALRWGKRIFVLPIGERFALVSITAALFSPKVTFIALLVWGGLAFLYAFMGRALRSLSR
jgi:hypothetical protein